MPRKNRTSVIFAGLAILSMVALLVMQTWVSVARSEMPPFSLVHAAPDGRVFVLLDGNLHVESLTGESLEVIPLSRLGVERFEGDFAVLSDDSIILKSARFGGHEPLQRCALKTGECRELSGAGEPFPVGVAFRLSVDEPQQRIRVAYTADGQLALLDFEGRLLGRQFRTCRYPSSMTRVAKDEFLVSDTRGARIVRISGRESDFGEELGALSVAGWSKQPGHTRPKGVAITGDGARWIVVTDGNISNGELYRLDNEASTPTRIPLPEDTDTMFPEALADAVLLPDGGVYRIHQFTQDGTRMSDFGSPELKAKLSGLATRARMLGFMFEGSFVGLLFVSLPLLIVALWMNRKETASGERKDAPVAAPARDDEPRAEYVFQRRFTVLASRDARRLGLPMTVLNVMLFTSLFIMVGATVASSPSGLGRGEFVLWTLLGLVVVLSGFQAVWFVQCRKHERMSSDARGLRYVSPFRGQLAFLERLFPSWELAWEEIDSITLRGVAGGRTGWAWYYELRGRNGVTRLIHALSWCPVGEDETGLTLRNVRRPSAEEVQAAIRETRLHRQLAEHLPGLDSSRA